jgi:hypothetical protein
MAFWAVVASVNRLLPTLPTTCASSMWGVRPRWIRVVALSKVSPRSFRSARTPLPAPATNTGGS